jgi:cell division protein FtsZ
MIIKTLIEKYFDNKVHTYPYGAQYFFQALDEIEYLLETPGLINVDQCDLCKLFSECNNIVITNSIFKIDLINNPIFPFARPSPFKNKPNKVFFNITGGPDMTLNDVNDVAENVYKEIDPDADILFGAMVNDNMGNSLKTTVIMGN